MMSAGMIREMSWEVDEEVNRDKTGEADGMNLEVDSKDEVMHIWMSDQCFMLRGFDGLMADCTNHIYL